jgi:cell wall-associated NlpC family hydrolase
LPKSSPRTCLLMPKLHGPTDDRNNPQLPGLYFLGGNSKDLIGGFQLNVSQLPELPSRRSLRESSRGAAQAQAQAEFENPRVIEPALQQSIATIEPVREEIYQEPLSASKVSSNKPAKSGSWLRSFTTMSLAASMTAVWVLPSYGFAPEITASSGLASEQESMLGGRSQAFTLAVSQSVEFSRGEFEVSEAASATVAATRELPRLKYDGPTARDYWKEPRFTAITSENLMLATTELVGVPYVFGGSTPAGIDCSGLVLFVYAQFGVKLPHSVYQQARNAKKISRDQAKPGDIVVFNDYSHNGIYAGNGMFIHAPQPGDRVKLAPIFTDAYHIVRLADIS